MVYRIENHLRITPHTHDPLDDARGNAEAFLRIIKEFGITIKLGM